MHHFNFHRTEAESEESPESEASLDAHAVGEHNGPVEADTTSTRDTSDAKEVPVRRVKKVPPPFSYKGYSPLAVSFVNRYYHNEDGAAPAILCTRRGLARMRGLPEAFPPKDAPFITRCRQQLHLVVRKHSS